MKIFIISFLAVGFVSLSNGETPRVKERVVTLSAPAAAAPAPVVQSDVVDVDAKRAEIKRKVIAAVEEVLMRYGNPPFAEIITNDPAKAAQIKERLETVRDGERLRAEIEAMIAKKEALAVEIALKETEIEQARLNAGRMRVMIDKTVLELKRAQALIEEGGTAK